MSALPEETMNVKNALRDPPNIPLRKLVSLTRFYYDLSSYTDRPRSKYHEYYYKLAAEIERRKLDLNRVLRGKNAKDHS